MNPMVNVRGASVKQVVIRDLNLVKGIALCLDNQGQYTEVSLGLQRTGLRPEINQTWLVDRDLSSWSLRALVSAQVPDWTPLTLLAAWTASADPADAPPSARVTADGWVECSGVITGGTLPTTAGVFLTVAQLPSGFPVSWRARILLAAQTDTTAALGHVCAALQVTGEIQVAVTKVPYAPTWIDLTMLRGRLQ